MVSVCLPSDALLQHHLANPSYLGFSYLGHGVSLHGCSSKAQPLLLTLDKGYLLTTALPDLQRGIAPLSPPMPTQPLLLGLLLPAATPGLGCWVAPKGQRPWPQAQSGSAVDVTGDRSKVQCCPILHRNVECQVHESRQIGSGQTRGGKSERQHSRNQQTKMDWNG